MVRNKRFKALQNLLDRKSEVSQILVNIKALSDDEKKEYARQPLGVLEKLVGEYKSAVSATRSYVHAPRARGILSKSCEILKHHFDKNIKPWLLNWSGDVRPVELDFCVEDIFPTSFFNQELPVLVSDSQLRSDA